MSEKCRNNNNSDNPLISRRTDGGKKNYFSGCDLKPCLTGISLYCAAFGENNIRRKLTHTLDTNQQKSTYFITLPANVLPKKIVAIF